TRRYPTINRQFVALVSESRGKMTYQVAHSTVRLFSQEKLAIGRSPGRRLRCMPEALGIHSLKRARLRRNLRSLLAFRLQAVLYRLSPQQALPSKHPVVVLKWS